MHKAKKFIGIITITILLTACSGESEKGSTANINTPEFETGIVNTDALKVRSGADADAEVLSLLEQGAVIKIIAEENDFYQIVFEGQDGNEDLTGYVKKEYIDLS
ncbi:MAG: SH3 domain-containing protein [Lachnospiraceae bacterium]|nr:SH3 domain-containing protein [Lachnospiraceae bacterium]